MKTCTSCNETKTVDKFYSRKGYKNGTEYKCIDCYKEYKRQYRIKNKDIIRAQNKRRVPGWDINRYNEYLELQQGKCAICGTTEYTNKDWCADHDHTTNQPRGLLCGRCNAGLGYFKDNPEYLQSAIDYLKRWQ